MIIEDFRELCKKEEKGKEYVFFQKDRSKVFDHTFLYSCSTETSK